MKKSKAISTEQNYLEDSQSNDDYGFFSNLDNTIGGPQDDGVSGDADGRLAAGSDAIDPDVPSDLIVIDDPVVVDPVVVDPGKCWLDDYSYSTSVTTDGAGNTVYSYSSSWGYGDTIVTSSGSDTYNPDGDLLSSIWFDSTGSFGSTTVTSDNDGNTVYSYSSTWVDSDTTVTSSSTDIYSASGDLISSTWSDSAGSYGNTTVTTDSDGNVTYSYSSTWADGDAVVTTTSTDIYGPNGDLVSSIWSDSIGNYGSSIVSTDGDGNTVYSYSNTWLDGDTPVTSSSVDIYNPDGEWLSSSWSDSTGNQGSVTAGDKDGGVIYWLDDIALNDWDTEAANQDIFDEADAATVDFIGLVGHPDLSAGDVYTFW